MDRLRTFGIVAHIDAGKTTLTERILFDTGTQSWIGNVDDGTAAMDWLPAERSRGISITAAATRVLWGDHVLQLVDTPGHIDFVAEVERCLHVLDGVVVVVDAVRGVESQTEAVWQQAAGRGLPRLVFVNKLDRPGADFHAVVAELAESLDCNAVPIVVPLVDAERGFVGLCHALTGAVQWFQGTPSEEQGRWIAVEVAAAHDRVLEVAVDVDDAIMADALAGRRVSEERLVQALRPEFLASRLVPVLAGAALWNQGVDWLLDAVVAWFPGLPELSRQGLWAVDRAGDDAAPFCGLVFKVQHVDSVWNFVRVVRGMVHLGSKWTRGRQPGEVHVVADLWHVRADRHHSVERAGPGEIVVVPGELGLRTGDTLCDPGAVVVLNAPRFPAPVLAVAFEPEFAVDIGRLVVVLRQLAVDDPTLRVDRDTNRVLVRGMGELHLDVVADLVRARTGVAFQCSRPQVNRRESVALAGSGSAEVRAVVAGQERFARCEVAIEPTDDPGPAHLRTDLPPHVASAAVEELQSRLACGVQVGAMHGCRVTLRSCAHDGGVIGEPLLQQAAGKALALAIVQAGLVVLEPWVAVEVLCPQDSTAPVIADLGARGADIGGVAAGRLGARVLARAPLARMLGYVTKLRSMTKGRGQVFLRPTGYRPSP